MHGVRGLGVLGGVWTVGCVDVVEPPQDCKLSTCSASPLPASLPPFPPCSKGFLDMFITLVDDWGPLGYAAYIAVYASLEILAVPAIPLTMTAGAIFGVLPGTVVVSVAATLACTGAFLIAR